MADQIRIEQSNGTYVVILEYGSTRQEMDKRDGYTDAENFACYLARQMRFPVYFEGRKIWTPS